MNILCGDVDMVPSYLEDFRKTFDSGDANRLAEHFAEDAVFECGGGQLVTGRYAIRYALENFLIHGLKLRFIVLRAVEAGGVSCVEADWTLRGVNKMNQLINLAGRAFYIFAQAPEGGWKIKIYNPFLQRD